MLLVEGDGVFVPRLPAFAGGGKARMEVGRSPGDADLVLGTDALMPPSVIVAEFPTLPCGLSVRANIGVAGSAPKMVDGSAPGSAPNIVGAISGIMFQDVLVLFERDEFS